VACKSIAAARRISAAERRREERNRHRVRNFEQRRKHQIKHDTRVAAAVAVFREMCGEQPSPEQIEREKRKRRGGPHKPRWLRRKENPVAFEAKRERENERKRQYDAERRAIYAAFRELELMPPPNNGGSS
jgi:hypothetical protein